MARNARHSQIVRLAVTTLYTLSLRYPHLRVPTNLDLRASHFRLEKHETQDLILIDLLRKDNLEEHLILMQKDYFSSELSSAREFTH
jgi:hypothetical protein